jgi:hypothetical protein
MSQLLEREHETLYFSDFILCPKKDFIFSTESYYWYRFFSLLLGSVEIVISNVIPTETY